MKCPSCTIAFAESWSTRSLGWHGQDTGWYYRTTNCPDCKEWTIEISRGSSGYRMIQPIAASRGPVDPAVPAAIASDYLEACNVFPISPKASSALSRRCLQNILNAHGYAGKNLAKQIDEAINEVDATKALGRTLRDTVDAVRNFGNFSAHPIDDKTTLQIIDVEPEEAEWCLQILEEMFDHFYVRPAQAAARKAALNAKLSAAGKPAAK